ncbi:hypothetical protein JYK13_21840 [Citrobacter sp. ku-bf4]|uniref:Rap1a/Tai family immunity protein n=1 Tax=Citrobacter TaxID=544 RepID=UPI00197D8982|nr:MULTISPECIES: Rap1a/Tai family immunity protein [Citrobacter]MBN6046618.1 hypothetical protein [Citrobacter sp. ku-bf4]MBS0827994.1 hypothetical protein [Citrobacter amalonaticus]
MKNLDCNVSIHLSIWEITRSYYWISEGRNIKRPFYILLIILCCLLSGNVSADSRFFAGLISPDNVNLSTRDFLRFHAINDSQEKVNILMYALGVQDATEGKTWCVDEQVDRAIINQTVLAWLERQSIIKFDLRASIMIEDALVKNYPCQGKVPQTKNISRLSPVQSLTPEAYNLSGNDFFRLWVSGHQQDKFRASIYLLGVEDATENKLWCGYDLFKTLTLNEAVYTSLKNKSSEELNGRAADLIVRKLMEYPCDTGGKNETFILNAKKKS